MGLFKKKPTVDPVDFLALRAELQDVKARLEASEQAKTYLEARLGSLDATTTALNSNVTANTADVGLQISNLLERIRDAETEASRVSSLQRRVDDVELRQSAFAPSPGADELAPKLTELAGRLEEVAQMVSSAPPGPSADVETEEEVRARLDELATAASTVGRLTEQLEELRAQLGQQTALAEQVRQIDSRLAEQATLAGEIEELRARISGQGDVAQQIAELRSSFHRDAASTTTDDEDARAAELRELARRLDDLDTRVAEHASVAEQIEQLDARIGEQAQLAGQIDQLSSRIAEQATLAGEIDALNARVGELQAHAGAADEVRLRVDRLAEQAAQTDALRGHLAQLAERVAINAQDTRETREQIAGLEARISSVGTELANQLSELGKEIDALGANEAPASPINDELLAALRSGQTRLANEQARYEIAFREDLATLAEQVRLLRGGR